MTRHSHTSATAGSSWESRERAMSPHYTNIQPNPSDGHQFRPIVASLGGSSLCMDCQSWPEEHACDICGERLGDHTEEMRARCAGGGRTSGYSNTVLVKNAVPIRSWFSRPCGCACHHGEGEFCACSPDECDPRLQDDTRPPLPPTCQKCGGLGHEQDWHNLVSWPDIAQKHARELRALANDLRRNEEHIAQISARGIARSARADTYEMVADRLEKDAENARPWQGRAFLFPEHITPRLGLDNQWRSVLWSCAWYRPTASHPTGRPGDTETGGADAPSVDQFRRKWPVSGGRK